MLASAGELSRNSQSSRLDFSRRFECRKGYATFRLESSLQTVPGRRSHASRTRNLPGQLLEDQESLERLRKAILDLRLEEKEVFLLRQNGGLTYEQIAEIRNAPVGTVKTQMRAALQKLHKVLN